MAAGWWVSDNGGQTQAGCIWLEVAFERGEVILFAGRDGAGCWYRGLVTAAVPVKLSELAKSFRTSPLNTSQPGFVSATSADVEVCGKPEKS